MREREKKRKRQGLVKERERIIEKETGMRKRNIERGTV